MILKSKHKKDRFFEYMSIDSGRIIVDLAKEKPLIKTIEKLKVNKADESKI